MTVRGGSLSASRPTRLVAPGLVLAGTLLVAANLRAGITVVGPLLSQVQADLSLSSTEAAPLIALPVLCFAVFSPLAPVVGRRLGIQPALALALGVLAAAIVLRSLPWEPSLWLGTVLVGAAVAMMNVLLPPLVKRDFPGDVGRVSGIHSAVQSGVAAIASAVAVPLAGAPHSGWRVAFGIWAGLAVVALGLLLALRTPRLRPAALPAGLGPSTPSELRAPWRTALGWQITAFSGSQALLYYTVLTWWPTVERASGLSAADAGLHQGLLQVVGIGASLLAGCLLHRLRMDARPAVVAFAVPSLLEVAGQMLWPGAAVAWAVLLGLGIGGTFVVSISLLSLRTVHPAQTAQLSAMSQAVGYAFAASGPIVSGGLAEVTGSWGLPLAVLLGHQLAQLAFGLLAARPRTLQDVRPRVEQSLVA